MDIISEQSNFQIIVPSSTKDCLQLVLRSSTLWLVEKNSILNFHSTRYYLLRVILPCSIAFITSWFAVSLFLSLLVSAMLNEYRGNLGLFWFCFTTLSDCSKIPSCLLNQPDLIQKLINKINKRLLHLHFSIFFGSFLVFNFTVHVGSMRYT